MPDLDYFRKMFDIPITKVECQEDDTDEGYEVDLELTSGAISFQEQAITVRDQIGNLPVTSQVMQLRGPTEEASSEPVKTESKVEDKPKPSKVVAEIQTQEIAHTEETSIDAAPLEPVVSKSGIAETIKSAILEPSQEQQQIISESIAESELESKQKALQKQAKLDSLEIGDVLDIAPSTTSDEGQKLLQETTSVSDNNNVTNDGSSEVEETVSDDDNVEKKSSDEKAEEEDGASEDVEIVEEVQGKTYKISSVPDKVEWNLTSPKPQLNKFYEHKAKRISKLLSGGAINVEQFKEELRNSSVDMSTFVFSLQPMQEKMVYVQRLRDRATQIASEVSFQLFHWQQAKKSLEGYLWKFITSKPVAAQEGANHEHLWDVHDYLGDLEGLYKSSQGVLENLKGAFETLSRQVTIVLGDRREVERYTPRNLNAMPQEKSLNLVENPKTIVSTLQEESVHPPADIDEFDELPMNVEVRKPEKKPTGVKKVDWIKVK
jgi:hypothetical protein